MSAEVLAALAALQEKVAEFVKVHEEQARFIDELKEWSAEISLALDQVEATQRDLQGRLERLEAHRS